MPPWRGKFYLYFYSLYFLAIHCPKLSTVKFATVHPPECVTQPIKSGRTCQFRCPDGYFTDDELHGSTAYIRCLYNGTWDVQVPSCVGKYFFPSSFPCWAFFVDVRRTPSKLNAQFQSDHWSLPGNASD